MEITSSVEDSVKYFELLNMKIVDEGLLIKACSKAFGEYFAAKAAKTTTGRPSTYTGSGLWKNGKFFAVDRAIPEGVLGFIRLDRQDILFWDGLPALQWFTHVDLAKGFELLVPEAISLNNFEDYFMGCATAAQNFHQQVLRKGELEAVLSYKEEG